MEPTEITVTTAGGQTYLMRPLPMKRLASENNTDWLKFVLDYVPGAVLTNKVSVELRSFLKSNKTDAVTDGTNSYTLMMNGLVYCNPDVVNEDGYIDTFGHENIKHPYADYKLSDAVLLARHTAHLRNCKPLQSLGESRDVIKSAIARTPHLWITGNCAMDVLDAAIDQKDLALHSRLLA